jgi:hypothetical protein
MEEDEIALRIEAFDAANGGGVGWYKDKGAYHLYLLETEAPIARLKPTGTGDEVRIAHWSHLKRGLEAAVQAAWAAGTLGICRQCQGMSSSQRAAGQSAAIFAVTSAM